MIRQPRHKVFVSYHHENDQRYKDLLVEEMAADIVDRSVEDGDIDERLGTEAIWEKIRDEHMSDATVLLVLIGRDTWSRRFVDWEVGSALNRSRNNSRCGVLGILLSGHPGYRRGRVEPDLLPQRLVANFGGEEPYVRVYYWPDDGSLSVIRDWVHAAFIRQDGPPPDNYSKRLKYNRDASTRGSDGMTFAEGLVVVGAAFVGAWAFDRFILKSMRARHLGRTQAPGGLSHGRPNRPYELRNWRRYDDSI